MASMERQIRYGTIGSNWITDNWIKCAANTKAWQLTAVYSRDATRAQSYATKHGISTSYTLIDDLAADENVEAVYIASPNSLHYEQAKRVLELKKHVILEKPATSTMAELDELFALADRNGVLLLEAWRHIQEENFVALRQSLADPNSLVGRIQGASLSYCSLSSRYAEIDKRPAPNIFSLEFSGGALVDVGVYPIAFAVALWGRPLTQSYSAFKTSTGVDGGGFGILNYDGFAVQIACSKVWTAGSVAEIYGEKGKIVLNATADIKHVTVVQHGTDENIEIGGPVTVPSLNMQDEAQALARLLLHPDKKELERLRQISLDVLAVTTDMRRQNGIVFAAERQS